MSDKGLDLTLHVWRQKDRKTPGKFVTYQVKDVSTHASFLEMLDILNESLNAKGEDSSRSITTAARASAGCARS